MSEDNPKTLSVCLDFAEQQGGLEKPPDGLNTKRCPRCGAETMNGFGLMGGGYGPYVCCIASSNACGWFYKEQERA